MKQAKASPFLVSLGVHIAILAMLGLLKYSVDKGNLQAVLDSVFTEERTQEEFEREADTSTQVAETMNFIAGSVAESVASTGGGGGGAGLPAV